MYYFKNDLNMIMSCLKILISILNKRLIRNFFNNNVTDIRIFFIENLMQNYFNSEPIQLMYVYDDMEFPYLKIRVEIMSNEIKNKHFFNWSTPCAYTICTKLIPSIPLIWAIYTFLN